MRYAGLGVQMAASLLLFVWIGQWADRQLGTGGLLTVVAAFLGFRRHDVVAHPVTALEGRRTVVSPGSMVPGRPRPGGSNRRGRPLDGPPGIRNELAGGMAVGFLVQAPLGWWHVRTLGTGRFQLVWGAGMLIRLLSVGVTALILVPVFRWQLAPALGGLLGSHRDPALR